MKRRGYWLARAAGGAAAGVLMAGAGVGIAIAGTAGGSDQYTKGAKPYAGVHPNDVTVGTHTFPSTVTTDITNTTVTQPYTVTQVYVATTATVPASYYALLETEAAKLTVKTAQFDTLLRADLQKLLVPSSTSIKTLSKAKTVSLGFTSPGSGKVTVLWKVTAGRKASYYVESATTLRRLGAITLKYPTKAAARSLLSKAKSASISASVTYKSTDGSSLKVTKVYKLKK